MALDFQRLRLDVPRTAGGIYEGDVYFTFPTTVLKAEAAITGFVFRYEDNDRPFYDQAAQTSVTYSGNSVKVHVSFWLKDHSGSYDDPYSGSVNLLAIVDRA